MAVVVSDTSPLRALAQLGLLDLLQVLFGQVLVPPAVAQELRRPPGGLPVIDVGQMPFVLLQAPQNQMQVNQLLQTLDPGEAEALALALEVQAEAVLIDEAAGRAAAGHLGLTVIGALGVLLRGKQRGRVTSMAPLLDRLENEIGFFISAPLRARVLQLAGE